jgi:hypothetical protein
MARSSYIYIVTDDAGKGVLKAFTVKREALSYLKRRGDDALLLVRRLDAGNWRAAGKACVFIDWRAEL